MYEEHIGNNFNDHFIREVRVQNEELVAVTVLILDLWALSTLILLKRLFENHRIF